MGFGICLQLVLVGHVLADFYLQSDAMARHKGVDHRAMAKPPFGEIDVRHGTSGALGS